MGQRFPLGSIVDVGVHRSRLSAVVLMLLGVPILGLIATGFAHRMLDPLVTETALALSGFSVFGALLLVLGRVAVYASAALVPRIVGAPIDPTTVRLLNNRRAPLS